MGLTAQPPDERPTVLIITHHLEELPPATSNVLLLNEGKVAAVGGADEVLRSEVLSPVYHCPLEVTRLGGRFYAQVHPGAWEGILRGKPRV